MESFLIYIAVSDKLNEPSVRQTNVEVHASPEWAALCFMSKNIADLPNQSSTIFVRSSWIFSETLTIDGIAITQPYESMGMMRPWSMFLETSLSQVVVPPDWRSLCGPHVRPSLNRYLQTAFKNKARQNPNQPCQNAGWIIRWRSLKFASLKTYIDYSLMES